ncbi:GLPGLI family protein [Chitinophaga filiformis]|uniref:GLPGLI family protein n=1 Tax=Chitinophaga filiformis TaxID=104663 RepID=A0ABY4HVC2_CHIFI|nr:GLPGLI family protein [Chitinophaga filiformis]UPK66938.1 GLPGLI family protein [Chitinophaga filiformis]
MQHIIRTLILAAGISCFQQYSFAQDKTQGVIHYDITYHIHASLKPDQMQYKDLVPETIVEKAELKYNGQRLKSYFNDDIQNEQDGVNTSIKVSSEDGNEKYADVDRKTLWWVDKAKNPPVLVERSLFEKDEDQATESAETQKILDYNCRKLVVKSKNGPLTIWYTTELPLKAGTPASAFTDKGVVLALDSKKMSFKATSIEFVPVTETDVTPPADLKIVKNSDHKGI